MTIKLTDLIEPIPADVEEKVRRVRDQAQPAVREALRAECRLMFRTPEESNRTVKVLRSRSRWLRAIPPFSRIFNLPTTCEGSCCSGASGRRLKRLEAALMDF